MIYSKILLIIKFLFGTVLNSAPLEQGIIPSLDILPNNLNEMLFSDQI